MDGKLVWGYITQPPKTESFGQAVGMAAFAAYFAAVDLPLSAVMDTLTLYITVPDTHRRLTDGPPYPGTPGKGENPPEVDNSAQPDP